MAQTYTRQSSFADGDTITAALFNNEYNQLVNAFAYSSSSASSTGHRHDGTAGQGGNIFKIGDLDFLNKIEVDSTNNRWGVFVEVSSAAVEQIRIQDGAVLPVTDSDVDLGTSSLYFKDAYIDSITTTGNVAVGGNLTVTGTTTFNGGTLTLGDAASDNVVFGADVDSNIIPDDDNTYDLGSSTQEWKDLYIDGIAYLDGINFNGTAITSTAAELNILDGVTSTAAELNLLDGVTSTTAELNILDGVTSTAAEINLLDGVTATTSELNILDGVTASAADINLIDGITNGTVIASKAIITDSNKDITGGRNITISGELDAATLDISGDADIDGTLEADAITIGGVTLAETISDTVGAMVSSNTESNISVTYEDSDNTLDFALPAALEITTSIGVGGGSTNGIVLEQGGIKIKNGGTQSYVDFYCESSNAHYARLQAPAHSAFSGNVTITLPATTDTLVGRTTTDTLTNKTLTTPTISSPAVTGTATFGGSDGVSISQGAISIKNGGTQSYVDFYCESSNAHKARLQAPAHSAFSGDIVATLPSTTGTIALTSSNITGSAATLTTPRTIHGVSFDGSANIDLTEVVQDTVGAMFSSNTETGIAATYEDGDGTIDLVIGNDVIVNSMMADDAIDSAQIADGAIDTVHIADDQVTGDKLANDITIANNLTVAGNLSVTGTTTQTGSVVSDSNFTGLLDENTGNSSDFGFYGKYVESSTTKFAGLFFDASTDNTFRLFTDTQTVPGTTVNTGATGYAAANLVTAGITATTGTFSGAVSGTTGTFSGDLNVDSGVLFADVSTNRIGINQTTPTVSIDAGSNTDAILIPKGTTAQRPTAAEGLFRYNTTTSQFEGYTSEWGAIAGSGGSGGSSSSFVRDEFTGDGSTTAFTLSKTISANNEDRLIIFNEGVFQRQDSYTLSGTTLTFGTAPANGNKVVAYIMEVGVVGTAPTVDTMTGDGSDTTLALSVSPSNENATFVTIDGVFQHKDTYAVSGSTLTFSEAPPTGTKVECTTFTNTTVATIELKDSDSDTKIQVEESTDEDKIRFDTGGTERVVIDSTGLDVTGIVEATGYLAVEGTSGNTGSAGDRWIGGDGTAGTWFYNVPTGSSHLFGINNSNQLVINGTGVGIGTSSPSSFDQRVNAPHLVVGSGSNSAGLTVYSGSSAQGSINFADGTTTTQQYEGGLVYSHASNYMSFHTNSGAERMRIDSSGNVGIGTTSPNMKVNISHADEDGLRFNVADGAASFIDFGDASDNDIGRISYDHADNHMAFRTNTTERMRIDVNGKVGINNTDPTGYYSDNLVVGSDDEGGITIASSHGSHKSYLMFADGTSGSAAYRGSVGYDHGTDTLSLGSGGSTSRLNIDTYGSVHIACTATPSASVQGSSIQDYQMYSGVVSTSTRKHKLFFNGNGEVGSISTSSSATAFNTSSDARLKDVTGSSRGLEVINALNPVAYNWKADGKADEGLIAQEVLDVVPNAVSGSEEEYYQMDYSKLVTHLVAGMKEQQTIIEELKARIETLEG